MRYQIPSSPKYEALESSVTRQTAYDTLHSLLADDIACQVVWYYKLLVCATSICLHDERAEMTFIVPSSTSVWVSSRRGAPSRASTGKSGAYGKRPVPT